MADPLMQAFCCQTPDKYNDFYKLLIEVDSIPYNTICLISSFIGIAGAVYQILPRVSPTCTNHWYFVAAQRGRKIIVWLAFADLMATLGICLRSVMKLMTPVMVQHIKSHIYECILFAFWVQYFYIASWFWTLVYAVDTWLALKDKPYYMKIYHWISWVVPAFLTVTGLYILYYSKSSCYTVSFEKDNWRFIPHFLATYFPMAMVMLLNPMLYLLSSQLLHTAIAQYMTQYTKTERYVVDVIKLKFGLINLSFYVCWLPNLISTIIIYTCWDDLPENTIVIIWYIMAIMNPLQALFNSLIYRRRQDTIRTPWRRSRLFLLTDYSPDSEKTPLVARSRGSSSSDNQDHGLS